MEYRFHFLIASLVVIAALAGTAAGQTPDEHASHHPAPEGMAPAGSPVSEAGNQPAAEIGGMSGNESTPAPGGGMGAGMGEMMKQMGVPPRKELYPSLMALPDEVTPEERATIEQLAQERMKAGTALMSAGLERRSNSISDQDYAAMQQATVQMREGLAQFEAGVAARRLLSEGKLPRNLALDWFKREMNLASPVPEGARTLLGVTPFHLFTMGLLITFALAMVAMYFFKMRRAAALFGRLGTDANAPPGSSPPLVGLAGPPVPVPGGGAANAG